MPRKALERPVAADIRAIIEAPDEAAATPLVKRFIRTYNDSAQKLTQWATTAWRPC